MASKKDILTNLREYSAEEIASAIKDGTVTMYELSKRGQLTPLMRKRISERMVQPESVDTPEKVSNITTSSNSVESNQTDDSSATDIPDAFSMTEDKEEVVIPDASTMAPIVTATAEPTFQSKKSVETTTTQDNNGMFKHPFSFNGRIRRIEYGLSYIIYIIWNVIIQAMMTPSEPSMGACIFVVVSFIPMIWFLWAQGAKRCHDRDNSGWYQIIPFYFLWMIFAEGDSDENSYGNSPK